ncbi:unnamed protein product [Rhizophagus irregularis]|nr:unnamed protein product [Rhizophagus irregularis]CAB5359299.1 unnamed protein product [Rhizophagus irregularis]
MDKDQQNIHVQRIMNGSEEREICYIKCDIKSGYLNGPLLRHQNGTGLDCIRMIVKKIQIGSMVIGIIAIANVLNPGFAHFDKSRVHYVEKELRHIFSHHKTNLGFNQDDNWNSQNREKLLETLQEFTNRNENNVNVYLGTYKNQSAYFVLSEDQYKYDVTNPPYKLSATVLLVYEDILEQISNSEGERDDLIKQYLRIYLDDKNSYGEKVYYKGAEFFSLAESYIPLSFEGRDEITPEDNYELDFEKIRERAGTILGELEKITL